MRVKGGDSRPGDFEVLRDSAAGNADGANYFASRALQQDAAGERRQSAIAEFQRGSGCARLAVFPNRLAVAFEQSGGSGFLQSNVDRSQDSAVHSAESLQMSARVANRDDHRNTEFRGFGLRGVNHCLRLTRGKLHRDVLRFSILVTNQLTFG